MKSKTPDTESESHADQKSAWPREMLAPTPSELALVAATLARNDGTEPSSKLIEAYGLIRQADKLLHPEPVVFVPIPLETRLAQLMPDITDKDYRKKKFFEYSMDGARRKLAAAAKAAGKPPLENAEIQNWVRHYLEKLRKEGVSPTAFWDFEAWREADKHGKKSNAGRKGAAMKQANALAKADAKARGKEAKGL